MSQKPLLCNHKFPKHQKQAYPKSKWACLKYKQFNQSLAQLSLSSLSLTAIFYKSSPIITRVLQEFFKIYGKLHFVVMILT